jgi:hypothetical protein
MYGPAGNASGQDTTTEEGSLKGASAVAAAATEAGHFPRRKQA